MVDIVIDEVTTGAINGSGAFDEIMQITQKYIESEYNHNRIKGADYSKVYLGSLTHAMQEAIAFVIGRQQASAQADLTILQGELVEIEKLNAVKQGELADQQILKMQAEVAVLGKQLIIMDSEVLIAESKVKLTAQQVLNLEAELPKILADTALTEQNVRVAEQSVLNAEQQLLKSKQEVMVLEEQVKQAPFQTEQLVKQNKLLDSQFDLSVWSEASERAKTVDSYLMPNGATLPFKGIIGKQKDKIDAEVKILTQKGRTEEAQTSDTVNGVGVTGIVGKQKELYQAQTDGFARKAEQDLAKIMASSYSVRRSTNEAEDVPISLDDYAINKVIDKAGQGIHITGLSTPDPTPPAKTPPVTP